MTEAITQSDALQDRMWALAEEAGRKDPGSITVGLFIGALNEVIDEQVKRVTVGIRNRVPPTIWATLYVLMVIGMAMMGAQVAKNGLAAGASRRLWPSRFRRCCSSSSISIVHRKD